MNISQLNFTQALSRVKIVHERSKMDVGTVGQYKAFLRNWPFLKNISAFLKSGLPNPLPKMTSDTTAVFPINARVMKETQLEALTTLGSLLNSRFINYRLYGHVLLLEVDFDANSSVDNNVFEKVRKWYSINSELPCLVENSKDDRQFSVAVYDSNTLLNNPQVKIKNARPCLPKLWIDDKKVNLKYHDSETKKMEAITDGYLDFSCRNKNNLNLQKTLEGYRQVSFKEHESELYLIPSKVKAEKPKNSIAVLSANNFKIINS